MVALCGGKPAKPPVRLPQRFRHAEPMAGPAAPDEQRVARAGSGIADRFVQLGHRAPARRKRRSARRQTVRQMCSSALSREPPGSTNERSGGSPSFIRSISRSSCSLSAAVMRACFGCTSSGSVARIEPRLKSSCCTRRSIRSSSGSSARRFAREADEAVQLVDSPVGFDAQVVLRQPLAAGEAGLTRCRRAACRRG